MAEFEADLAEDDELGGGESSAKDKDAGEETWVKGDRDYKYEEVKQSIYFTCAMYWSLFKLLSRFFKTLRDNNPELAGEKRKYTIVPPAIQREGNKKTIFANIADICRR